MRALVAMAAFGMLVSCTFPSVTFGDASVPGDAGDEAQPAGDAGDAGDPCDEDNDGYKAQGACGGDDCNDHDPRAHPDAGYVFDVPDAAPYGDWNCDGNNQDYFYKVAACAVNTCSSEGLAAQTGCGITAAYVTCTAPVTCAPVDAGTRTQGCR